MEEGDEGREVGGDVGLSSLWAAGACAHHSGWGEVGHCLFVGSCARLCVIISVFKSS